MQDKDAKLGLGTISTHLLTGGFDVFLQFADGVFEGGAGVVDLVDDEDAFADEVFHGAEGAEIEPLGARHLGANLLHFFAAAEGLVEGEADGLDRNVGGPRLFEKGAEDAGRDIAATADGDHELGLEFGEQLAGGALAELMDLVSGWRGEIGRGGGRAIRAAGCVRRWHGVPVADRRRIEPLLAVLTSLYVT